MYAKLDRLTQEEVNHDLAGLLQDPQMQKAFSHHVLPLLFEIQHEVMLASAYEGTMYAEAESKMDLIAELFESEGICSMLADCLANGVSVMNSVYEYVLDGVQRLREYRKKVIAKNYEKIADRVSIPATYDVLYKNWTKRLHHIEESRKEMGEYVLEEGRDIEKEKKVYENGIIDDADLISLLNLFD